MPEAVAVNIRRSDYDTYVGRPRKAELPLTGIRLEQRISELRAAVLKRTATTKQLDELVTLVGVFGNPWKPAPGVDAIAPYREYIKYRVKLGHVTLDTIRRQLVGKRLGCFCKPRPCHADTLAALANAVQAADKRAGVPTTD